MTRDPDQYNFEMEMAALYMGGVLGGLFFGSVGDLVRSEIHSMAWYAAGTILGAVGGAVAGLLFRKLVPQDDAQESLEPSP
jgi:membrane associated rhomboid family serine protease